MLAYREEVTSIALDATDMTKFYCVSQDIQKIIYVLSPLLDSLQLMNVIEPVAS